MRRWDVKVVPLRCLMIYSEQIDKQVNPRSLLQDQQHPTSPSGDTETASSLMYNKRLYM